LGAISMPLALEKGSEIAQRMSITRQMGPRMPRDFFGGSGSGTLGWRMPGRSKRPSQRSQPIQWKMPR